MKKYPWDNWYPVPKAPKLQGGGQGHASVVRNAEGTVGVLKKLKNNGDPERRQRMHREGETLRTLTHTGIPKLLDSNTLELASDVPLYIVTEYVPGPTLEEKLSDGPATLDEALLMTRSLCATLVYAHAAGVLHRDIKPDNVVLRDGFFELPALIDFGLSYNFRDEATSSLTPSAQQLGNRFLALPELLHKTVTQRDARSDVTQVLGLLLFALTRVRPTMLLDQLMQLPHQRPDAAAILNQLPNGKSTLLRRIFDRGFKQQLHLRWQSAEDLSIGLNTIVDESKAADRDWLTPTEVRKHLAESPHHETRTNLQKAWSVIEKRHWQAARAAARKLENFEATQLSSKGIDWDSLMASITVGVAHAFNEVKFFTELQCEAVGNELIVSVRDVGETVLLRAPLDDFSSDGLADSHGDAFALRFESYLLKGVGRVVKRIGE